jgi:hypothetical protein
MALPLAIEALRCKQQTNSGVVSMLHWTLSTVQDEEELWGSAALDHGRWRHTEGGCVPDTVLMMPIHQAAVIARRAINAARTRSCLNPLPDLECTVHNAAMIFSDLLTCD